MIDLLSVVDWMPLHRIITGLIAYNPIRMIVRCPILGDVNCSYHGTILSNKEMTRCLGELSKQSSLRTQHQHRHTIHKRNDIYIMTYIELKRIRGIGSFSPQINTSDRRMVVVAQWPAFVGFVLSSVLVQLCLHIQFQNKISTGMGIEIRL